MKSTISVEDIPDPQNLANKYMLIVLNDFDDYVYSKKGKPTVSRAIHHRNIC